MNARFAGACLPLCMSILAGCELLREPTLFDIDEEAVAVHGMFLAAETKIAVLVTRFELADDYGPSKNLRLRPVEGADVRVAGPGGTIALEADRETNDCNEPVPFAWFSADDPPLSTGCYTAAVGGGIVAGTVYELYVALPNGKVVTGMAEVPQPVVIRSPDAGATLEVSRGFEPHPHSPFPLAWSQAGHDHVIQLRLEADHADCFGPIVRNTHNFVELTGRDSADAGDWALGCRSEMDDTELDGVLNFAVFDVAYAQYLELLRRSVPHDHASIGLTGAVGIFTGAAITRLPVRLVLR